MAPQGGSAPGQTLPDGVAKVRQHHDEQRSRLPPLARRMLDALTAAGEVGLTHEALWRAAWGPPPWPSGCRELVSLNIARVRRALGRDARVECRIGWGYRLVSMTRQNGQ
jgi:DNA-binding response OmpR family regulator